METGKVTISRAAQTVTYPAAFLLVGAMNPCPCGNLGSRYFYCTCSPKQITAYTNRISGSIQDRMDILLKLDTVVLDNESSEHNETSEDIRKRVTRARDLQHQRHGNEMNNARLGNERLMDNCKLNEEQQKMMQQWTRKNNWSTRVQMKTIRLARTISDLSGHENITNEALWEAVTMRRIHLGKEQKGMVK